MFSQNNNKFNMLMVFFRFILTFNCQKRKLVKIYKITSNIKYSFTFKNLIVLFINNFLTNLSLGFNFNSRNLVMMLEKLTNTRIKSSPKNNF